MAGLLPCAQHCHTSLPLGYRPSPVAQSAHRLRSSRKLRHPQASTLTEAEASSLVASIPIPELQSAEFCGSAGVSLDRPATASAATSPAEGKRYHIRTFGCQMNLADSERMAGVLEDSGYVCAADASDADVIVYNTCSIREKAETKVYSALGRQAKRKRAKMGEVKLVLAGCVASQEGAALLRRIPELDLVMGPHHANQIVSLLERVDQGSQVVATEPIEILEDVTAPRRDSDLSAWVNVIHGCNEKCTYCVVPNTRGKEQSRRPEHIRREMAALGDAGYKEVTLLGQNVDAYGRDLEGFAADNSGRRLWTFTDLLYHVHDVEGIERIRFATSHPRYFTERLVQACARLPKLCEFFHIPFQSGDNDILRHMRRGYTHERYRRIIDNIRRHMPDASVSGDAIVGYPGETEEQFEATVRLVEEVGFDRVNTAAYSPRPGTPAAVMEEQVAELIKMDRLHRLNEVVNRVAEERAQRFAGRDMEVLVEGPNPRDPMQAMGRTRHNKVAFFPTTLPPAMLKGQLVTMHVDLVRAFTLFGHLVEPQTQAGDQLVVQQQGFADTAPSAVMA
ncbi:hypothetical protein WJX73_010622 [Symbiochloris irregularis]|uniref:Uncharacterized protein n=1 Tax=Symbiochloris irregularis TaxID=706552 RepID=A0AAW1P164_9CHLO